MTDHSFDIEHFLSSQEIRALEADCVPSLRRLNLRYAPQVDLSLGYPTQPEYLDAIRTSWLSDGNGDRPQHTELVKGLGLAFGMLLQKLTPLRWCSVRDTYGIFNSMVRTGEDAETVSVPVFSYVEKREMLQNAEVFCDFFKQVPTHMVGS
jgi:hypothetical protein